MTPHQTLAVTVRMFALWLFLFCAATIFQNYNYAREHGLPSSLTLPLTSVALVAVVCWLLWAFPLFIAKRILPVTTETPIATPLFESWFSVGCSLVGLFALSKSIPALASYFVINYMGLKLYPGSFQINTDWPLHVTFNILQVVFGLWLFLGAKGLKKVLMWVRGV